MYKKITIIIILLSTIYLYGETPIPLFENLSPVYKNFDYTYYYIESGLNSNSFFSLYMDYIDKNKKTNIFLYPSTKKNKFFELNTNIHIPIFNTFSINLSNKSKYTEKDSILSLYFTKLEPYFFNSLFFFSFTFNNTIRYSKYFYNNNYISLKTSFFDNEYKYSLIYNKFDFFNFFNNAFAIYINKRNINIGFHFFRIFYPYIDIKIYSKNTFFSFSSYIKREPYLLNYSMFSTQWDNHSLSIDNMYYSIESIVKFSILSISFKMDAIIDSVFNYSQFLDDYNIKASFEAENNYKHLYIYSSISYIKNDIFNDFLYTVNTTYKFNHFSITLKNDFLKNKKPLSSIILCFNNKNPRITIGLKNIFETNNTLLYYYAPFRTYFLNIIVSNGYFNF